MRRMLLIAGVLCSLFLAGTASAVEYKWTGEGFVEVSGGGGEFSKPVLVKQAVTIPRGMHAHTRLDGTTYIHGDENHGKAGPHEGVAYPWYKTGTAGQTVIVDMPVLTDDFGSQWQQTYGGSFKLVGGTGYVNAADCPNGQCPVNRRVTHASTTTDSVKTSHVETVSSSRKGPLRQIVENIRNRREQRQSNRQSRGSGGCP